MTHARHGNETLSVEQANILDRYLDKLPNYALPQFKRRFEAMARELTDLGFEDGWELGKESGFKEAREAAYDEGYNEGHADGYAEGLNGALCSECGESLNA